MKHPRYKPIAPHAWASRIAYLQQAIAHHRDPRAPEPDIGLLTVGPHGPLRTIVAGTEPETGRPYIAFNVQNEVYKPRFGPPLVFLVMDLLLAWGGGCSFNDNNKGFAYVRLFSGNEKQMLGRILLDTKPGEIAKQHTASGERTDYHNYDPAWFSKTTAEREASEGRLSKAPHRGRKYAIETALRHFRANYWRSGIKITEAKYLSILEDAFKLLDAKHRYYLATAA